MGIVLLVLVLSTAPFKHVELSRFSSQDECETFMKKVASQDIIGYKKLACVQIERFTPI